MELDEINALETSMGIEIGFFASLVKEDDWSFVIKLHALIEGAVTHLLVSHFDDDRLSDVFARIELSGAQAGKIAFLKSMNMLSSEMKRFIVSFSELRNMLVHNVSNVNFSFSEYVGGLDDKEFDTFAKKFSPFLKPKDLKEKSWCTFIRREPKRHIWVSAMSVLTFIANRKQTSELERSVKAIKYTNDAQWDR